jgi:hypothetical protein
VVGDLLDFRELVRRKEDRGGLTTDVADQRLQHVLGHRGIETRRRFIQDQQFGATREREQQCQLGASAS